MKLREVGKRMSEWDAQGCFHTNEYRNEGIRLIVKRLKEESVWKSRGMISSYCTHSIEPAMFDSIEFSSASAREST